MDIQQINPPFALIKTVLVLHQINVFVIQDTQVNNVKFQYAMEFWQHLQLFAIQRMELA